ncbi:phosphatase PAP2/dual specificity phosphatase family protein [Rahnella woolbedingensis]|uniref:Phosphatase PAP2 family protein n=1 Tax=Rahnella woolbedingensis TaxID=1510574 RepID=A0A419NAS7_9GAMM|nr:phosphatase PAP2/dual specificity phosphatase family protein [Rahnella woolbedingensis]RJT45083.1 phosphatase PAP2 family protein [Rahnella woolbedingensis]
MTDIAASVTASRPWKQGLGWLLILGPLFLLCYSQVNQYTATRHDVGSLVFNWEQQVPFMPWTIVPYWSIDLLYGISLFICTSKQELTRHGCRLLAASLIACVSFLLFPLKFTFTRPETQGFFGWLFGQLEQFDLPYNQAPSLHIIITWLLWLRFRQHIQGYWRHIAGFWFLLIAVSVLTTWQHHFIDVVSGVIVALCISYAIPVCGKWQWHRPKPHALRLASKYAAGAIAFSMAGVMTPYACVLFWPSAALFLVAAAYAGAGTAIFQKDAAGHLSIPARILLLPYLVTAGISKRGFVRNIPAVSDMRNGIFVGCFPLSAVEQNAVLDLTAEFQRQPGTTAYWSSCPLMDLVAPDLAQIKEAVNQLTRVKHSHDTVLVCCALGLSRSATIVAAWLIAEGRCQSAQQATAYVRSQRRQVVFSDEHLRALEHFQKSLCQTP